MHACNGIMDVELAYRADGTVLALARARHRGRGQEPHHPDPAQPDQARQHRQRLPDPRGALRGVVGAHQQVPERGQPRHRQAVHVLRHRARDGPAGPAPRPGPGRAAAAQLRHRRRRCPTPRRPAPSTTAATTRRLCAARSSGSATRRWRAEQAARARSEGRLLGIGIATSVEPAGTNLASYEIITGRRAASGSAEAAMVRMEPDGQVRVSLGDPPSGQGYETVLAQIVADELGLTPDADHGRPRLRLDHDPVALSLRQLLEQVLGHRRGRGGGRGRARAGEAAAHRRAPAGGRGRGSRAGAAARWPCAARRTGGSASRSWRAPPTPTCSACRPARSRGSRPATRTRIRSPSPIDADSAACARSSSSPTPRTAASSRWTRAPGS